MTFQYNKNHFQTKTNITSQVWDKLSVLTKTAPIMMTFDEDYDADVSLNSKTETMDDLIDVINLNNSII